MLSPPVVTAPRSGRRRDDLRPYSDVASSWGARTFRCYPVSLVMLAPYVLFVLPVAVVYENPDLGFLVRLVGLALTGSVLVETAALPLRRSALPGWDRGVRTANDHPRIYLVARGVTMVSILADLTGAAVGRGPSSPRYPVAFPPRPSPASPPWCQAGRHLPSRC